MPQAARAKPNQPKAISVDDISETAKGLRRVLDAVERGGLTASNGLMLQMEGAIQALEALTNLPAK
jgi:hypothetical protein